MSLFARLIHVLKDLFLPLRLRLGRNIRFDEQRQVVQVSRTRLLQGPVPDATLEALAFASAHTRSGAVPRVHDSFRRPAGLYLETDFIPGPTLEQVWSGLDAARRRACVARLWDLLAELRALTQPSDLRGIVACSAQSGGPMRDPALAWEEFGPCRTVQEFRQRIRRSPNELFLLPGWEDCDEVVFTHGDLAPRNIILRDGDESKVCLIDWEMAGWRPAYWECAKWHFADFPPAEGWVALMDDFSG